MLNIVLFGPPGAGKGTQSKQLIAKGFTHISPGNIFREEIHQHTLLGRQVQKYIDKGRLVPNELVVATIAKKIKASLPNTTGLLFDGYPRTHTQAVTLDTHLAANDTSLGLVIFLVVNEKETKKRIKQRSKTLHRADDQNEDCLATRMQYYQEDTLPLVDYYNKQKKLVKVVAEGTIAQVATRVQIAINTHLASIH